MTEKLYKIVNGIRLELTDNEIQVYNRKANDSQLLSKEQKINNLKSIFSNQIYSVYPLSKQIDIIAQIGGYTEEDLCNMKTFINGKIQEYRTAKSQL